MTECTHCRKRYENGVKFCPVDGYAVVPLAEPMVGRLLMGQFQIQSVCGHGATGTVYRATQVGIDREVAVKLLRADLLKDPDVIKRFVREARAGARLNHPNIATVHMVGQTDEGVPFLAMEFVEGVPLSAVLGVGKPMPLRRLCHIGAQIASALAEAHGQGIVHRDLKPENILLTERRGESDVVKVVDFGIAKMIAHAAPGEDPISRMGTVFGTPHYIAPEQAAGQPVDGRADIYSLGCILFQMATGRVPFDGQQGLQVLLRQVRDPVPDPRTLNPRISDALAELILKMLAKDPSARPQSAALTVDAIRALDSEGEGAPAPAVPRSGAPRRKETSRSGAPVPAPAKPEPTRPEQSWYQQEEEASQTSAADRDEEPADEDEDEEEEEVAAVAARPAGRRRRSAELERPRSGRPDREPRSGARRPPRRPSQDSLDESEDRQGGLSFWQRSWMPIVGISSAIVLGALAGLLYAHYHAAQPVPPPLTPPPVALAPAPAATALVKSSSSGRTSTPARPPAAAAPAAAPARQPEPSVPVTVFPAAPPLTGPRPLGPGPAAPAPAPAAVPAPAPAAPAPPLAVFAPAPAPAAAPTVTAPPPAAPAPAPTATPAPAPAPAAAPAPAPAPAVAAPAATPAPEAPKPAPAAKPEEPAAPAKPAEGKSEESDDSSSDPYHRLK